MTYHPIQRYIPYFKIFLKKIFTTGLANYLLLYRERVPA